MSSRPELKLDWCSYQAAKYAVEHWHYSRSMPTPPLVKVGVWEDGAFIGCVIVSRGATQHIGSPFGLRQTEVVELTRVALREHIMPVSRILRVAIKLLHERCNGLRLVVSFADPSHGHYGGIYQGAGWFFMGQTPDTIEFLAPDGKQWHGRMVSAGGRTRVYGRQRTVWRRDQCVPIRCAGKYKYVLPLDAEMRQQILPLAQPYPKRLKDSENRPADQRGEGGLAPTQPLHFPIRDRLQGLRNG